MLVGCIRRYYSTTLSPSVVIKSLKDRGLLSKCTNIPEEHATAGKPLPAVYVGFDPTANSLHVGNLVAIMALLHFQRAGYQPLAVVGGATGLIGDPSGRIKERNVISLDQLQNNVIGISSTLSRITENAKKLHRKEEHQLFPQVAILNNADWYKKMTVIEFMSKIGRHFRLQAMIHKESVQQRLNSQEGMNFTEFSYQIFQSYDFYWLATKYNCWLQIGGSDQWGNITAGCGFVRSYSDTVVHGLTVPLITSSTGEKLGKSAGNAVWLSPDKTSPYHLYQYFYNTTDDDVEKYLKYFTFIPIKDIHNICDEHRAKPEDRVAQKVLAENVAKLIHGEEGLIGSQNASAVLFGDQTLLSRMSAAEIEQLFQDAPSCAISKDFFTSEPTIIDIAIKAGVVQSRNEARRLINSGGLYINNARVESSTDYISQDSHVIDNHYTILRKGKRSNILIKWT